MDIRYSPSTGCFYPDDIDYAILPDDLIPVSPGDYAAAMARPDGHTFDFVAGALVIAAHVPTATEVAAAANADIKAQIDAIESKQARAVREQAIGVAGALDRLKAIDVAITALRAQLVSIP